MPEQKLLITPNIYWRTSHIIH